METKINKEFIISVDEIAQQSILFKRKVGAVLVSEKEHILFSGFNKNITNTESEYFVNKKLETYPHIIHAEENVIIQYYENLYRADDLVLYCTYTPCWNCAKLIVHAKVKKLIYLHEHKTNFTEKINDYISVKEFLEISGVEVIKYEPK